jgi:hypothetical protein
MGAEFILQPRGSYKYTSRATSPFYFGPLEPRVRPSHMPVHGMRGHALAAAAALALAGLSVRGDAGRENSRVAAPSRLSDDCSASDASLRLKRETVCASLVGPTTPWCTYPPNVTASGDWPNQAVYMHAVVAALADPATCLNTSYAADTVDWLNGTQADPTVSGAFMNTWVVFQAQYYDMPRQPGSRIEAPDTLGRKCWAFAYLRQLWEEAALERALAAAGLSAAAFASAYDAAVPKTMELCSEVLANCFVNASYDPSRNGTCPGDSALFYLGFQRENALRGFIVAYPFYG